MLPQLTARDRPHRRSEAENERDGGGAARAFRAGQNAIQHEDGQRADDARGRPFGLSRPRRTGRAVSSCREAEARRKRECREAERRARRRSDNGKRDGLCDPRDIRFPACRAKILPRKRRASGDGSGESRTEGPSSRASPSLLRGARGGRRRDRRRDRRRRRRDRRSSGTRRPASRECRPRFSHPHGRERSPAAQGNREGFDLFVPQRRILPHRLFQWGSPKTK